MTEHSLWRFSRALHRAINERQHDELEELIDDDVDWAIYGPIDMFPFLGARRGKAAVLEVLRQIADNVRVHRFDRETVMLGVDSAASMLRYSLTTLDSNKPISLRLAHFAQFKAGRLSSIRVLVDTFDLVEQALGRPIHLPKITSFALNSSSRSVRAQAAMAPATISRRCARINDAVAGGRGHGLHMTIWPGADAGGGFRPGGRAGRRADAAGGRPRHAFGEVEASAIPDASELDWSQLDVDAATLMKGAVRRRRRIRRMRDRRRPVVVVERQAERLGRGLGEAAAVAFAGCPDRRRHDGGAGSPPQTESQLLAEKLANGGSAAAILGHRMGRRHRARRRLDLGQDRGRSPARSLPGAEQARHLLSKSIPFSEQYSLTLQNGYNVTQQGVLPLPGIPGRPARNYDTEQSARLSIAETGTSFMAGQTLSTADDKWLRKIGAEQKLFGDVTINGSIGETPQGATNKSVTAGSRKLVRLAGNSRE